MKIKGYITLFSWLSHFQCFFIFGFCSWTEEMISEEKNKRTEDKTEWNIGQRTNRNTWLIKGYLSGFFLFSCMSCLLGVFFLYCSWIKERTAEEQNTRTEMEIEQTKGQEKKTTSKNKRKMQGLVWIFSRFHAWLVIVCLAEQKEETQRKRTKEQQKGMEQI